MLLPIVGYAASSGRLREVYDRMRERPRPPVYRPEHGGSPGIIEAHRRPRVSEATSPDRRADAPGPRPG